MCVRARACVYVCVGVHERALVCDVCVRAMGANRLPFKGGRVPFGQFHHLNCFLVRVCGCSHAHVHMSVFACASVYVYACVRVEPLADLHIDARVWGC